METLLLVAATLGGFIVYLLSVLSKTRKELEDKKAKEEALERVNKVKRSPDLESATERLRDSGHLRD